MNIDELQALVVTIYDIANANTEVVHVLRHADHGRSQ
jgi:hypothetical protein